MTTKSSDDSDPSERVDPFCESYRELITEPVSFLAELKANDIALLVIDMQYLDAARGYGVFAPNKILPESEPFFEYYFRQLEQVVVPNIALLQTAFRKHGLEVIHTRIQSLTLDGRDRSPGHKRLNLHAAPGSKEAEFLTELAPLPDEIVINKTASGVFSSTNLEYVLRNLGIKGLFITGVYTNECVSTAVRVACDRGFHTTLIQDACTTVTPDLQASTIRVLRDRYARIMRTQAAIREIHRISRR